ncbi:EAL domain-containing protein [Alloalcanivorax gelatiniphagus]|uniref:EAL domain-containing protein n=1 Tax=Alloalcanivorax gelatiniphagus TaxID=1194167 RepID=A0ABY2XJX2_9GAMM|nr:EAL domain-containing protein [Alloalcanivorax gelatiniphagus]TMW12283.1 EAL domain-containing protein [Alloalcanivorax gelatiniphagus]|tara:strand:+ start:189 stop:2267 length:2079 start_codon:yes stop_codon:yes gene_type:complete
MTYALDTLRLLIAHDSQDEAEQLMNALRNAGRATRAQLALNEDDLVRALKGGAWELMLCRPRFGDGSFESAMAHINRLGKVLPVVLLSDDYDATIVRDAYNAGARAVAPKDDRELLMQCVDRLMEFLRLRKELQHSEITRHEAEKRLRLLMDQSRDAIAYVLDGMHIQANDNYARMFGYQDAEELAGVPIMDMVSASDHGRLKTLLRNRAQDQNQTNELECRGVHTEGHEFEANFIFSPSTYDGEACTQIVIRAASLDENALQERLHEISQTDQITGLYSRSWFMEQLDQAVSDAARQGQLAAVLYLRLDDFEQHQSRLGMGGADEVLRTVADWLRGHCADARLARVDGEDFAVLKSINDIDEAAALAETLRAGIETLMPEVANRTVHITASLGVAFAREDARSSQDILTKALKCCNQAQRQNDEQGNAIKIHDPMDDVAAGSNEAVALSIRQALEKGSFRLRYQPLMSLRDDGEQIFEVFVHMPQKQGDDLAAAAFMPVAADQGMAGKVDRWVVLNAMRAAAAHEEKVTLLVNLSGYSLGEPGLAEWLSKAMRAARLSGEQVIFQFSEGDTVNYLKQAGAFAQAMRKQGCGLSISRFGGSLDPFKLFEHIPATMVKFEGSFTQELGKSESRERFAELIQQVQDSGRRTVVGFVESAAQMQTLWTLGGVDYLQGYYLQAPMDRLEVAETTDG